MEEQENGLRPQKGELLLSGGSTKTWNSMAILIVLEVFLVLITTGTGVIEGVLQMASESLGGFMRS